MTINKYKYAYGSFVFEQLLIWIKTFCHHVEHRGPAEMNDVFFFSRKNLSIARLPVGKFGS